MKKFYLFFLLIGMLSLSNLQDIQAQCGAGQTLDTYCYAPAEVNNVAFEVCPAAGMAVESNIIQGSFFAGVNDNLTVYSGTSGSGTAGSLVFGPASGNVANNTFSSAGADQCLIFVINSNAFGVPVGCSLGTELELQVCSQDIAAPASTTLSLPIDELCINDGVQNGLGGGLPVGGVYSGMGVTDDGNGTTFSFDPAAAGAGTITITYTNGTAATDDITVFALGTVSFTALADLCIDAGIQSNLSGGSPAGGSYSGPGVTDNGNGTYNFNPALAGLGMHSISYTDATGCMETVMDDVEVLAACGCPASQTSFFYCQNNNENNTVAFEVCPSAGMAVKATITGGGFSTFVPDGDNLNVYSGTSGSGTSGTLISGPLNGDLTGTEITGSVVDDCLIFVINTGPAGSCQDGNEAALAVCGEDITSSVSFTNPGDFCSDDGVQTLGGGLPAGGTYSGSGVTDDGNGTSFSFDPAAAGLGQITLTYTFSGSDATTDIVVFQANATTFTALDDLNIDAGVQFGLSGGMPAGGSYSGPGVTDNGNGTYNFNPAIAGLGVHTITYTDATVCMGTATDDVEVLPSSNCQMGETSYFYCYDNNETDVIAFEICPNAGEFAKATITAGTYEAGDNLTVYQGASGSGTGGTIVFGPMSGDLSGNAITATVADECLTFVSNSNVIISCQDGVTIPLSVCASSLTSPVNFTAPDDLSINAGIQANLSGGFPTGGVYSGPGVTDDGNGMTYTFNPLVSGLGIITITYTLGGNSASDQVQVLNLTPPSFSKSFSPNQVGINGVSVLTFTIENNFNANPAEALAFVDNLPADVTVATNPNIQSSCIGGTITAVAGSTSISYSDGSVAGSSSCTISVNVVSSTAGTKSNITGDLTSSFGNSGSATADLTVFDGSDRPLFSKAFSPSTVNLGERSTLTFTIDNTLNPNIAQGMRFEDNLPMGMVVASPSNATTTCTGGLITAVPGSNLISYTPPIFTDGSVAAGSSCVVSVDVEAIGTGTSLNVSGGLTSLNNFFQTRNSGIAVAALEVNEPGSISIDKSFGTNPVRPGETTMLNFTLTNFDRDFDATNVSFTDDLNAMLSGATVTGTPVIVNCGGGSISGTSLLSFSGGTIPPNSSCSISVEVQIPAGATIATYTNTTSTINGNINGTEVTGAATSENLFVANLPTFTKTFLNNPIVAGGTTTLEFTITNTSATSDATNIAFTDNISAFLSSATISAVPNPGDCGAGSFFFSSSVAGQTVLTAQGLNIPASGSCTFSLDLLIEQATAQGTYTNTTSFLSGEVDGNQFSAPPAVDDLMVLGVPKLNKSFINDPVNPGETVDLEFTITHDENATSDATGLSFTDDLNAVLSGLTYSGSTLTDICGTGSQISGTDNLSFTGGTLSPGSSCTFTLTLNVPANAVPGIYTNTTSSLTAMIDGQVGSAAAATDELTIGGIEFTKEFLDDNLLPGEIGTVRYTITNNSNFDATSLFFSDNFGGLISGMAAQAPLPTTPCGASANLSGTTNLILFNGEVTAGSSCSFDVEVLIPTNASNDTYISSTSDLSAQINGSTVTLPPAMDEFTVNNNLLQLTKSFTNDPAQAGGTVNLEYTLTNLNPDNSIIDIAFTDDLNSVLNGLQAFTLPASVAGGTLSGTDIISLSGGSLAPGATTTFTVGIQIPGNAPAGASFISNSSNVSGITNGLDVEGDPASDELFIEALTVTKSIAGPATEGGTTTITFTISNASSDQTLSNIEFIDDLDAFISGMTIVNLPMSTSTCGSESGVSGTSVMNFGRGELGPNSNCSFTIEVNIPCGTAAGTYTNTTSQPQYFTSSFTGITQPATATLEVLAATSSGSFTAPDDLCINAGIQIGLSGGLPVGGTYSGPGVTDDGNGMTYTFDPAVAGSNIHTITYSVLDDSGCKLIDYTDNIIVYSLPTISFTAPADLCFNNGVFADLGGGVPTGGTYSGSGVTDNGDGLTYDFDPAAAGVGTHIITYSFTDGNGCTNTDSDDIEVFEAPNVSLNLINTLFCDSETPLPGLQGTGLPEGGVYSGPGVTDDGNGTTFTFLAGDAEIGMNTITYTFTNTNGCTDSATDQVEVFARPTVTLSDISDLCENAGVQTGLGGGSPSGGTYFGSGVTDDGNGMTYSFDPSAAGVGTHTIGYAYNDENGCSSSATIEVEVFAAPVAVFVAINDTPCANDDPFSINNLAAPTGGVFTGPGVTDDGNGSSFTFDPAAAGAGTTTITYTFTNGDGCTDSATSDITVFTAPNVSFTAPDDICVELGVQTGLGGGLPEGGVYSGPGVTDDGNGMTYTLNPTVAGVGTHTITYEFTTEDGCSDSASDDVAVLESLQISILPFNNLPFDDVCLNETASFAASVSANGPPAVQSYSWTVSSTGFDGNAGSPTAQDGSFEVIDASWSNSGPQTIDLEVTFVNGCTANANPIIVNVRPAPAITCPANQTVQTTNMGDCSADVTITNPTNENDACTPLTLTLSVNGGMPAMAVQGASNTLTLGSSNNTLEYIITDGNGNTDNCSFTITVEDNEPPMPVCTDISVEFNGEEFINVPVTDLYDEMASTDNCGVVNLVSPTIDQMITCDQVDDIIPVLIEVNDGNGNTNSCTANITVEGLPCGFSNTFGLGDCFDPNGNAATYNTDTETFTLTSDGCTPEFPYYEDDQSFITYELCGDGVLDVYVSNVIGNGYAGVQMRETNDAGARKVALGTNAINKLMKQVRVFPDYPAFPQEVLAYNRFWLRMERIFGFYFRAYASVDGINYTPYIFQAVQMGECIQIGLFVQSKVDGQSVTAEFTNVTITETSTPLEGPGSITEYGLDANSELNIGLTPNPAREEVTLDFSQLIGQEATIQIFNINGQLMQERQIDVIERSTETFAIERFPTGTYWISVQLATHQQTLKLIKQ